MTLGFIQGPRRHVPERFVQLEWWHRNSHLTRRPWSTQYSGMSASQIVDRNKTFHTEGLESVLGGFPSDRVHVVAILGPQSSGKSTLLNGLFSTAFQVMDETKRRQTTQGIWASRGNGSDILVLDVEGTDGRERGEDQDFERKSALFSLAIAEILIVNIWENSVGLYHAANMSLLRTVMDVHLQLSDPQRARKTVLLFVVRDYAGKTPSSNLRSVLSDDLRQIWDTVKRTNDAADLQFDEAFELRFSFLPHKILQPSEFESEVIKLRAAFTDRQSTNYMFSNDPESTLAAHDLPVFASNIWGTIDANKDLDLPTERELLAQYRCDEIANLSASRDAILGGQIVSGFSKQITGQIKSATVHFELETARYSPDIASKKLNDLTDRLLAIVEELTAKQMDTALKISLRDFHQRMELRGSHQTFAESLNSAYCACEKHFQDILRDTCPPVLAEHIESYELALSDALQERSEGLRMEEANALLYKCQRKIEKTLQAVHDPSYGMGTDESFWPSFWSLLRSISVSLKSDLDHICVDIGLSDKRSQRLLDDVSDWLVEEIKILIKDEFSAPKIFDRILACFESSFAYDEAQLPRIWRNEGEVEVIFKDSREYAFKILTELESNAIPDFIKNSIMKHAFESDELSLLDDDAVKDIRRRIEKQVERRFIEAKRSAVSSQSRIPSWVYLLLLVLGWNEIMTILKSPMYLLLFLLLCGAFAAFKIFNLQPYLWLIVKHTANIVKQNLPEQHIQNKVQSFREKSD